MTLVRVLLAIVLAMALPIVLATSTITRMVDEKPLLIGKEDTEVSSSTDSPNFRFRPNDSGDGREYQTTPARMIRLLADATLSNVCRPRCGRVPGKRIDCCSGTCVDRSSDKNHCGRCRKKCSFNEACCGGRCVNLISDRRNCGKCQLRCPRRSRGQRGLCFQGLCNYA